MDERQARGWLEAELDVPRETMAKLDLFVALLVEENGRQNLVSRQSLSVIWNRHIVDSAQLIRLVPPSPISWIDLGSGPGLPGIVIAIVRDDRVVLVEERRKRVEFLERAVEALGLGDRVEVVANRVEQLEPRLFDVISARAFAPLDRLLVLGQRFAASGTRWVLPKGKNAQSELDAARASWQGEFRLELSLTDADARIIVAERVRRRGKGIRS